MGAARRLLIALLLVLGTGAAGLYAWYQWDLRGAVQSTADAYVRGEITALSPRVAGYVVAIMADENTQVAAHEVLVQIDPRDYQLALQRAQAAVEQARAQRERAQVQRRNQTLLVTAAEAAVTSRRHSNRVTRSTSRARATCAPAAPVLRSGLRMPLPLSRSRLPR